VIHHVSLPARDPARVAAVLAELTGGAVVPFSGARGYLVALEDAAGTAIEVVADTLMLKPGEGDRPLQLTHADAPNGSTAYPFHMLLTVAVDQQTVMAVGAREGWRTRHFWRGSGGRRDFELIELWVENRLLIELVTPEMAATYARHMAETRRSARPLPPPSPPPNLCSPSLVHPAS
jgi:hypothetical protein